MGYAIDRYHLQAFSVHVHYTQITDVTEMFSLDEENHPVTEECRKFPKRFPWAFSSGAGGFVTKGMLCSNNAVI